MERYQYFHLFYYFVLVAILIFGIILFHFFAGYPPKQFIIVCTLALFYVFWGVIYHKIEGDLHRRIVVEYLLIAFLVVLLFRGAIYQ